MNKNLLDDILKSMQDNNYKIVELETTTAINERKNGKVFSFNEHVEALIWSLLSNQRPWKGISDNKNNIRKIFHDFDYKYILNTDPDIFTSRLKQIKCGNRAIKKQMQSLNYNINVLLKIEAKYGTIDNYISSDEPHIIAKQISSGCYKLKQIGFPLAMEYLRNVGIDTIKPDVHICRILGSDRLGFSNCSNAKEKEAVEIIKKLSNNSNLSLSEIDYILWQSCADGYAEICTKNPKCKLCRASSYCHYNK